MAKKSVKAYVVSDTETPVPTPTPTPAPKKRKSTKKTEPVVSQQEEHIIVQLPITTDRIQSIIHENAELLNPLEYSANIIDPEPYIPLNNFTSHSDSVIYTKKQDV